MRVLLLVAIIASLAVTSYGQGTATARFYTNQNCTGTEVATGNYPYGAFATTAGASPAAGNCNALTGSAPQFVANATTYINGLVYSPAQTVLNLPVGSWQFQLNSGSTTCSATNIVASAASLDANKLDACTAVTSITGGAGKWWVKVTSAASTATISTVIGLVAVLASLATSL